MSKINTFIITLCMAGTFISPAFASDCDKLNEAMKKANDNANDMAIGQVDVIMTKPDLSALESCLGGISGVLGGYSMPGFPNLDDLLNQACETVVDAVYDKAMDGIGADLKNMDMTVYRTNNPGMSSDPLFRIEDVDVREPDIDLQKSIENIFN